MNKEDWGIPPDEMARYLREHVMPHFSEGGCQWCALEQAAEMFDDLLGLPEEKEQP